MSKEELFEKYLESAKDAFRGGWSVEHVSDEALEEFFQKEAEYVKHRFEDDYQDYLAGEMSESVLTDSAGRSVGFCLVMCY